MPEVPRAAGSRRDGGGRHDKAVVADRHGAGGGRMGGERRNQTGSSVRRLVRNPRLRSARQPFNLGVNDSGRASATTVGRSRMDERMALMKSSILPVLIALSVIGLASCAQQQAPPPPPQQAAAPPPAYAPPPPVAEMTEPPPKYVHHCKAGRHWIPAHYAKNGHRVRGHCSWGAGYHPAMSKQGH
jgi:hypothetical protein